MRMPRHRVPLFASLVLVGAVMAACVSDHIIYKSTQFPAPPANAGDFLGYANVATQQTVCGNCHVDRQTEWLTTLHSHAWNDLANSGAMQGSCQQCHTVSELGNSVTDTAVGWGSTHDARYHDVQCENCHGPGLTHVTSPSIANRPLATLSVGASLTTGCGECHHGAHEPFEDEWALSAHALMPQWSGHAHPESNTACQGCHTGQGALAAWGVNTAYMEANFANGDTLPITCGVCHDPHNKVNDHQLRFPINVPDVTQNLCMRCHQRGSGLDPSTVSHGPHSPEGPLLLGTAGWWPPGLAVPGGIDTIIATHGSSANPGLCATCHVNRFTVNDSSGKFVFQVTGHQFRAIPCLDENGIPDADTTCNLATRSFNACTASGCHGSQASAQSAYITEQARVAALDTTLRSQLSSVLATMPAETSSTNGVWTTAQGSLFNALLAERKGSFVHNPFLVEALLTASIQQMTSTYGVHGDRVSETLDQVMSRYRNAMTVRAVLRH